MAHVGLLIRDCAHVNEILLQLQLVLKRIVEPPAVHVLLDGLEEY